MANRKHVALLKQGVEAWNAWRRAHPKIRPNLFRADLTRASLSGADLRRTNLGRASLRYADLSCRSPIQMSPLSPIEMSFVMDPLQRG